MTARECLSCVFNLTLGLGLLGVSLYCLMSVIQSNGVHSFVLTLTIWLLLRRAL